MRIRNKFDRLLTLAILALSFCFTLQARGQTFGDTIWDIPPGACAPSVSAAYVVGAAAGIGSVPSAVGTAFTPVAQAASSAAATDTISCDLGGMTRTAAGKGLGPIFGFAFYYGIVTTAATSQSAPTCVSLAPPTPAAGETASVAAGTAIPVTVIPVVGSANLGPVTVGQFFTTFVSFTTPNSALSGALYAKVQCSFSFVQGAASAMVMNSPGGAVFTSQTISWLKHHSHDKAVLAMMQVGISHESAELIFAHYRPRNPKAIAYMARYQQRQGATVARLGENTTWGPAF